jgi:16S rRNA (guanine1516-N2)-methyltransferase
MEFGKKLATEAGITCFLSTPVSAKLISAKFMLEHDSISVSSTIHSPTILQKAVELAAKLNLPYSSSLDDRSTEFVLTYSQEGLQLRYMPPAAQKSVCLLFIDFVHGKNGYRLAQNCTTKQPIARAVGIKPGFRPTILDATAGLGADAFVLASLACRVTMCERSPIIGALLEDALSRAAKEEKTAGIVERLELIRGDTREFLQKQTVTFHTIYLDPMYPHRNQSSLNKQSLRVIRSLVGGDQDSAALLQIALECAENRVVVKRPRKAPLLSEVKPSHVISMKNSRFDIYLTFKS